MKNIKIIKTGINVSKIRKQLEKYPEDWGSQKGCLLYTSPSPRDLGKSRMPSSA